MLNRASHIKNRLKRWPNLYLLLQKSYYDVCRFAESSVLGSRLQEWRWRYLIVPESKSGRKIVLDSHPHRDFLLGRFEDYIPFRNVFEFGCHTGENLFLLAKQYPYGNYYGIDINRRGIRIGREWLFSEGVTNVRLRTGSLSAMRRLKSKSFDIVFTNATLMYVSPPKIKEVVREMVRLSRELIVLLEWNIWDTKGDQRHLWYDLHWAHDYETLFKETYGTEKIALTRLPDDVAVDESWRRYGALIEACVKNGYR